MWHLVNINLLFSATSVENKSCHEAHMLLAIFSSHRLKDLTPSSLVHRLLLKWKPVANSVCHSEGMHQMVKSCYMAADEPIKAPCFCLFRLQREYWSAWKTAQSNAVVCQRAPGGRYSSLCSWNFIENPAETCTCGQTSWWQSARAELFWKSSLEVGVHNDSNEDHQNASDGYYQLVSSSQSFNYKAKKRRDQSSSHTNGFWKMYL